jgi:hypothetical protein
MTAGYQAWHDGPGAGDGTAGGHPAWLDNLGAGDGMAGGHPAWLDNPGAGDGIAGGHPSRRDCYLPSAPARSMTIARDNLKDLLGVWSHHHDNEPGAETAPVVADVESY